MAACRRHPAGSTCSALLRPARPPSSPHAVPALPVPAVALLVKQAALLALGDALVLAPARGCSARQGERSRCGQPGAGEPPRQGASHPGQAPRSRRCHRRRAAAVPPVAPPQAPRAAHLLGHSSPPCATPLSSRARRRACRKRRTRHIARVVVGACRRGACWIGRGAQGRGVGYGARRGAWARGGRSCAPPSAHGLVGLVARSRRTRRRPSAHTMPPLAPSSATSPAPGALLGAVLHAGRCRQQQQQGQRQGQGVRTRAAHSLSSCCRLSARTGRRFGCAGALGESGGRAVRSADPRAGGTRLLSRVLRGTRCRRSTPHRCRCRRCRQGAHPLPSPAQPPAPTHARQACKGSGMQQGQGAF